LIINYLNKFFKKIEKFQKEKLTKLVGTYYLCIALVKSKLAKAKNSPQK